MQGFRQIIGDVTRALSVLALLVFALGASAGPAPQLGASPAVAAAIAQSAASELCGGGWGDPAAHFACHACKHSPPALPPAPCIADPVVFAPRPMVFAGPTTTLATATAFSLPLSRAPPLA